MSTVAEDMATWIAALRYEDLPSEVVTKAKRILLDTVGCALGALDSAPVRMARQVAFEQGGKPLATPWGSNWKTSIEQAAFLNSLAIRYLDFNDYSTVAGHSSVNAGPAFAIAEPNRLGGKDLILGLVIGYEVEVRVLAALTKGKGWDHSAAVHFSAAAVAGRLMGLPPERLAHALAIAGSHAVTPAEVRRARFSMWKGVAEPMGARSGTFAALLAQAGLMGPLTILEGKYGFGRMVAQSFDEHLLRKRSGQFQIMQSCIKAWPCLFVGQAPVAAALNIRRQAVTTDQIKKIVIYLNDFGYEQQKRRLGDGLETRENADHSVPYCVARALLSGDVRLEHFEPEGFRDARALDLFAKVSLRRDRNLPKRVGAKVEVRLSTGKSLLAKVPFPPGHVRNELPDDALLKKFLTLGETVLGTQHAKDAAEMLLRMEELTDLGLLTERLRAIKPMSP